MNLKNKTCYMCDLPATSGEHAPPQCIFPEASDKRINLLKVPSCDLHNNLKKENDVLFRDVLTLLCADKNAGANEIYFKKTLSAVRQAPSTHSKFFKVLNNDPTSNEVTLQSNIDDFDECVDSIARAIFYKKNKYKNKWLHSFQIRSLQRGKRTKKNNIYHDNLSIDFIRYCREILKDEPNEGSNLDTFIYRTKHDEKEGYYCFGFLFYEYYEVYGLSTSNLM